jgi:hypothetical protein
MIGFPAKYQTVYQSGLGAHGAQRIIAEAFEQLGWKYSVTEQGVFRGRVPLSGLSWGETVIVRILEGNVIQVESRCGFQMIDWGKNKSNVTRFIGKLQQAEIRYASLGPGSADQEFEIDSSSRLEKLFADDKK